MAPPIYVRGGLWTNIEDQILKAAVQKYGVHQWSKIASLLQKKNARQCEIRWNEYLNPTLNFEEFTKEEDKKLLELVRTLPNQWRTISELMGRPSQQCIERYNILLETELSKTDGEATTSANSAISTSFGFKPNEIHPSAETQKAKPDNDELDEDEREMLSEARARLLNTQGKKATRKVRERMLEESKRIAQIQKRRELKQAGINTSLKKSKKKYENEIDYNADVVYEIVPPAVLYDVTRENERTQKALQDFERNIAKKGKRKFKDDGEKESSPRKRSRDKRPNKEDNKETSMPITSNDSVLLNDMKKPVLNLSAPRADGENLSVSSNNTNDAVLVKKYLTECFSALPTPKNDFEILWENSDEDDEQEIVSEEDDNSIKVQESEQLYELPMETFDIVDSSMIPSIIADPKNEFEEEYNKLIEDARTRAKPTISKEHLQIWDDLNEEIQKDISGRTSLTNPEVQISTDTNLDELRAQIQKYQQRISNYDEQLHIIKPLVENNEQICNTIIRSLIPELKSKQLKYYTRYYMFMKEQKHIKKSTK